MVNMKIPAVRERKKNRMKRSQNILKVHDIVTGAEEQANYELNSNDHTMIPKPLFRKNIEP